MHWLMNLVAFSAQLAVLVVAGAIVMTALRVDAPRASLRFWQTLFVSALLWPLYQLWEGPTVAAPIARPLSWTVSAPFPNDRRRRLRYRRADHDRRRHDCRLRRAHQAWLARDRAHQAARDRCLGRIRRRPRAGRGAVAACAGHRRPTCDSPTRSRALRRSGFDGRSSCSRAVFASSHRRCSAPSSVTSSFMCGNTIGSPR